MESINLGTLIFEGYKSFDTLEEAKSFKRELGNRYLRTRKCVYPDMTFYIVEYDTPRAYFTKDETQKEKEIRYDY